MEPSRDDFVIAIRSAFLKKGTKQRFSLIFLILFLLPLFIIIYLRNGLCLSIKTFATTKSEE